MKQIDSQTVAVWVDALVEDILKAELSAFVLIGIVRGGDVLARRLAKRIAERTNVSLPIYHIDITLYRDDLYTGLERPTFGGSNLPLTLEGQRILLVDDVLFTGRTIRSAIQELMDSGRPEWIKLLVLVDRGHRELPIQPDFVAQKIECAHTAKVQVHLTEDGVADRVVIEEGAYE